MNDFNKTFALAFCNSFLKRELYCAEENIILDKNVIIHAVFKRRCCPT